MEKDVEFLLVKRIRKNGGLCVKFSPMGLDGFPDRIILLSGGRTVFVELKDKGKKPRPLQVKCHKVLRNLGFRVEVIDSKEGVEAFVEKLFKEEKKEVKPDEVHST